MTRGGRTEGTGGLVSTFSRMDSGHSILLLVHKEPDQVRRLVRALSHPRLRILVHVDAKFDSEPFRCEGAELLERRRVVDWSGFGGVRAALDCMEHLGRTGGTRTLTLLTGQDYPLRPAEEIVRNLDLVDRECIDLGWSGEDRRYRYEVFWAYPREQRFLRRNWDRIRRHLWYRRRFARRIPRGLEFLCGSAYWTLTWQGISDVLRFVASRPDVVRFFENTFASDEMFFQMVLKAAGREACVPPHHYIAWEPGARHPGVLGIADLPAILSSGKLFARKFEKDDPVLDELDRVAGR